MNIDSNSWHWRLYKFNSQWVAAWKGRNDFYDFPRHGRMIGLCPYMRMILIWGPIAMLSNIFPLAVLAGTFLLFPVTANGVMGIAWLIGVIVLVAASICAMSYLLDYRSRRCEANRRADLKHESNKSSDSQLTEQPDTFWTLFCSYVVAVKTKICPVLQAPNE
jgi:hypothetical protein